MKVIKPDDMALLHRTVRLGGVDRLCIGQIAFFALDRPELPALLPEAALWQAVPRMTGAPAALDEGYPKPRGEFLVYGEAHAPHGRAVPQLIVSARVGALHKQLLVQGDRHWNALGIASTPQPFTRMAITPQTAFGGTGHADNPTGKGATPTPQPDGSLRQALPNIEDPRTPVAFAQDRPAPAGFWGLDSNAPQRLKQIGRVDTSWLQQTWPHLPDDTQAEYFQSAPPDQRIDGFFNGDEELELLHLHPEQAQMRSRLPSLRARCFVRRRGHGGSLPFEELTAHAETVWLMPGLGCAAVLYRATVAVNDPDALDVTDLVGGWENMHEARQPDAVYRAQLPGEAKAAVAEPPVAPGDEAAPPATANALPMAALPVAAAASPAATVAQSAGATPPPDRSTPAPDPQRAEIERLTADMQAQTDRLLAEHGIPRAQLDAMMNPPPPAQTTLEEIESMTLQMQTQHRQMLAEHGLSQEDVDAFLREKQGPRPREATLDELEAMTEQMLEQKDALMREHGLSNADVADFLSSRGASEEAVALMKQPRLDPQALYAALPSVPAMAKPPAGGMTEPIEPPAMKAQELPADPPPPQPPPPAPSQPWTRERVVAHHREGLHFVEADLSGLDLSGLDLTGADFSRGTLEAACLDDALLGGARFDDALMPGASFRNADLVDASFLRAKAAGSVLSRANASGASFDAADFPDADFEDAALRRASFARADFSNARMNRMDAKESTGRQANFTGCVMEQADFSGARLAAARFDQTQLAGASFSRAACERSEWYGAQAPRASFTQAVLTASRAGRDTVFDNADLRDAKLDQASWEGADLRGADLQGASLKRVDLSSIQGQGLRMPGADARGANLSLADLKEADCRGANLMDASLRRARLDNCRLDLCNLHGSDCQGSNIGAARTEGALVTATVLAIPGRPEHRHRSARP